MVMTRVVYWIRDLPGKLDEVFKSGYFFAPHEQQSLLDVRHAGIECHWFTIDTNETMDLFVDLKLEINERSFSCHFSLQFLQIGQYSARKCKMVTVHSQNEHGSMKPSSVQRVFFQMRLK